MKKLQYSGYDCRFRYDVVKSGIKAYRTIRDNEVSGLRPINRAKDWKREERLKEKETKKKSWYKDGGFDSVMFVPATPNAELRRMYQKEISESGIRIRVVEKVGTTLKKILQSSNPFRNRNCGRLECFICSTSGIGNCNTEEITYIIKCDDVNCTSKNTYKGESADNGFTRGKKHLMDLKGKQDNTPLWRHCKDEHGGQTQTFTMKITRTFRNDAMLRQITEAVQIENTDKESLMNSRSEWNMTRIPRATILAT